MSGYFLFSIALVLQALFFIWFIIQSRIPIGHDTFQYFSLQYYFLNNAVFSYKTPLWMPFMTQGTVASWWYGLQAGLLVNALSLFAPLLKGVSFVYIFLAGFWVDELILLIGCWLWARLFFGNIVSVFFFTVTMVMTSVWWTQPWYNFHLYYCLPLMFYCIHRLVSTSLARYAFVLVGILILQLLGNLPYFFPMTAFMLALYLGAWLIFYPSGFVALFRLRWKWISIVLFAAVLCGLYYYTVTYGTDQIVCYNLGRGQGHTTNLNGFLNYGGALNPEKWAEMILGVSLNLNYTLYAGVLVVPLLFSGISYWFDRNIAPLFLFTVLMFDLSSAGITARLAYYLWPLMKYYRHLGLLGPVLKMMICFLATFVLDRMLSEADTGKRCRWLTSSFLLIVTALVVYFKAPFFIEQMVPEHWPELIIFRHLLTPMLVPRMMMVMDIALMAAGITLVLALSRNQKIFNLTLTALIVLHVLDLSFYKIQEAILCSVRANPHASQLTFKPMPFKEHRQTKVRRLGLIRNLPLFHGVEYWSNDSFDFIDEVGSHWRVEHWLKPLDEYMRAYWGQPIDDTFIKPKGLVYYHGLDFPLDHPATRKLSGVEAPKIQFFTDALFVSDKNKEAQWMADKHYLGDIPLVTAVSPTQNVKSRLSEDRRLNLSYTLLNFSADNLKVRITTPQAGWLMYSDVWHPQWQATVNNHSVAVLKANLAYKIVRVNQGENNVEFNFGSWQICFCRWLLSVFSLFCLIGVFWLVRSYYANQELL